MFWQAIRRCTTNLVQKMYLRQLDTYRGIFAAGRRTGAFTPNLDDGRSWP